MGAGTQSGYDYDDIQSKLTRSLLIDLWDRKKRNEFLSVFVRPNLGVEASIPPIVGIGISESGRRSRTINHRRRGVWILRAGKRRQGQLRRDQ